MIYLASPFFTPEEEIAIDAIEVHLDHLGLEYFSPRKSSANNAKKRDMIEIFDQDVKAVLGASLVIAFTDGRPYEHNEKPQIARDAGTSFEMGMAYTDWYNQRSNEFAFPNMITVSTNGFGTNLMLAAATAMHFTKSHYLMEFLSELQSDDYISAYKLLLKYRAKYNTQAIKEELLDERSQ